MDLNPRTHSRILPYLIGTPNIDCTIYSRLASFFKKGYFNDNKLIATVFKNSIINHNSIMCRNVNLILRKLNLNLKEFLLLSEYNIKKKCKAIGRDDPEWRVGVALDLLGCRDGVKDCGLSRGEVMELLNWVCTE